MMPEYAERLREASEPHAPGVPDSASGTHGALPDSASGTPLADSGSAPSPSPSPSPSPKERSKTGAVAPTPAELFPEANPEHLRDWLKARQAKRLPLTETAAKGFRREAAKAGLSAADAVRLCAEKGWAGLSANWQAGLGTSGAPPVEHRPGGGRRLL